MYLKSLSPPRETKTTATSFGGIDRTSRADFGSLYDSFGILPDSAPTVSSGVIKFRLNSVDKAVKWGGFYKKFYFFEGDRLCYDSVKTDFSVSGEIKSVVGFGNFLVVFPQKLWFNTDDFTFGSLENRKTLTGRLTLSTVGGEAYGGYSVSDSRPVSVSEGTLWLDTSGNSPVLKRFHDGAFYSVSDVAVCLRADGVGDGFSEGDSINVDGGGLSGSFNIREKGDGFITFGSAALVSGETGEIALAREVPDITYAVEFGNRIWGCSESGTEIFASELGKKDCFYTYRNTAADSFAVSVGENTAFQGAIELSGRLYFFKSRFVYMLQGNKPQNFQLSRVSDVGISENYGGRVVQHDGCLYYFSDYGLMRFDGSAAERIDKKLGTLSGERHICSTGDKLYVADADGVYAADTRKGEFYKIDGGGYSGLYNIGGILCLAEDAQFSAIRYGISPDMKYMMEFNKCGKKNEKQGFITKLGLSVYLGEDADLSVEIAYDDGEFQEVKRLRGKARGFTFPLSMRRCTVFRLRLSGVGEFRLYSLSVYRNEVD